MGGTTLWPPERLLASGSCHLPLLPSPPRELGSKLHTVAGTALSPESPGEQKDRATKWNKTVKERGSVRNDEARVTARLSGSALGWADAA